MGTSTFCQIREEELNSNGHVWRSGVFADDVRLIGPENSIHAVLSDYLTDVDGWTSLNRTFYANEALQKDGEDWFVVAPKALLAWPGWDRFCSRKGREDCLNSDEAWDVRALCAMLATYDPGVRRFLFCWRWVY